MSLSSRRQRWRWLHSRRVEIFGGPVGTAACEAVCEVGCEVGECGVEGMRESGCDGGPPADAGGGVDVDYEEVGWKAD